MLLVIFASSGSRLWAWRAGAAQWGCIALAGAGVNQVYHPAALIFLAVAAFAYLEVRS